MAACFMLAGLQGLSAQEKADSLSAPDSLMAMESAPINLNVDSIVNKTKKLKTPKDWSTWRPNPKRALWLALVTQILETATHLWRIHGLYLCNELEQHDVQGLFAGLYGLDG